MHSSYEARWSSAPSSACSLSSAPPKPAIERLSLVLAAGMIRRKKPDRRMTMRSALFSALLGTSALIAVAAAAQTSPPPADQPATQAPATQPAPAAPAAQAASGAADLCKELLAYAERKAAEPPKPAPGQLAAPAQAQAPAKPPAPPQGAPQPAPAAGGW